MSFDGKGIVIAAVYDAVPAPREPGPKAGGKWLTASVTDDIPAVIAAGFDEPPAATKRPAGADGRPPGASFWLRGCRWHRGLDQARATCGRTGCSRAPPRSA